MEYQSLADLVGVKIEDSNDGESAGNESMGPSSGMISARRRAHLELAKAVEQQVKISQEQKEKILGDKAAMSREAEELKRSIEEKKSLLANSQEKPLAAVRTSQQNPVTVANDKADEYYDEEY